MGLSHALPVPLDFTKIEGILKLLSFDWETQIICISLIQYTRKYSFFPAHQLTAPSVIITLPPTKGALQRKMLVYVCNILLSPQTINMFY